MNGLDRFTCESHEEFHGPRVMYPNIFAKQFVRQIQFNTFFTIYITVIKSKVLFSSTNNVLEELRSLRNCACDLRDNKRQMNVGSISKQ